MDALDAADPEFQTWHNDQLAKFANKQTSSEESYDETCAKFKNDWFNPGFKKGDDKSAAKLAEILKAASTDTTRSQMENLQSVQGVMNRYLADLCAFLSLSIKKGFEKVVDPTEIKEKFARFFLRWGSAKDDMLREMFATHVIILLIGQQTTLLEVQYNLDAQFLKLSGGVLEVVNQDNLHPGFLAEFNVHRQFIGLENNAKFLNFVRSLYEQVCDSAFPLIFHEYSAIGAGYANFGFKHKFPQRPPLFSELKYDEHTAEIRKRAPELKKVLTKVVNQSFKKSYSLRDGIASAAYEFGMDYAETLGKNLVETAVNSILPGAGTMLVSVYDAVGDVSEMGSAAKKGWEVGTNRV